MLVPWVRVLNSDQIAQGESREDANGSDGTWARVKKCEESVWGGICVYNNAAGPPKDTGTGGVLQCGEDRTTDVLYCLKRALLTLAQQYPYHTVMEVLKTSSVVL